MNPSFRRAAEWFLRISLAAGFLSAVADRFGLWGGPGSPGVAWGDWAHFRLYADQLNGWLPAAFRQTLAVSATIAETVLGIMLLIPWRSAQTAVLSGFLLSMFALAQTLALGAKAPLDYSVWTAAGGAFLLATVVRS